MGDTLELLKQCHKRFGWGILLAFPEDFLAFYNGGLCLDIGCNVCMLADLVGRERYIGIDIAYYGDHTEEHSYSQMDKNCPLRMRCLIL